jgi:flavin reductase (DIM6/NTAB) family NADH-FMN oxidoreductase RutF
MGVTSSKVLPVNSALSPIAQQVRITMRDQASTVAVLTAAHNREQRGITITSWTSVTLSPNPVISVCIKLPSKFHTILTQTNKCCLNVLSLGQANMSQEFASHAKEHFKEPYFYNDYHSPVLINSLYSYHLAHLDSKLVGDHLVWFGRVEKVVPSDLPVDLKQPLIYTQGSYKAFKALNNFSGFRTVHSLFVLHHRLFKENRLVEHLEQNQHLYNTRIVSDDWKSILESNLVKFNVDETLADLLLNNDQLLDQCKVFTLMLNFQK